ncbi:MAG TPA: ATP-grasp ribosomal peptide maturase [Pseudonocardia sp.]|uniref:ATP-grasp ribosomal peptide maturase n=1 Tax=Pseudonocardia sp. TaxID=60912 RepID=UPI002F40BB28
MTVVVLTEDCDPAVDAVITELARREVPVFRADTAWFPLRMSLAARLVGGRYWSGRLDTRHREVDLAGVRSVWYRRPTAFELPEGLSGPERQHALWEARYGLGGVLADLPVLWVNHPGVEADVSYKPVQLATAVRCELDVPATLITNRPDEVRAFAAEYGPVVVKSLAYASVFEDGVGKALYTHALSSDDLAELSGVASTAHLLQRFVADKAFEARVTVVGDRVFAAAIHAGSDAARVDWRADQAALTFTVVEVPGTVKAGIHRFMRALRLQFAAFDFVIDYAGTWWFLECNSAGQYGFVEAATGLPITSAMAELLASGLMEKGKP